MPKYTLLLLALMVWGMACTSPEPEPDTETSQQEVKARPEGTPAAVMLPRVQLKEQPGAESTTLSVLKEGDSLYLTGEISKHRSRLSIGGRTYERPWLFGRTAQGTGGWIHGAAMPEGLPVELQLRATFSPPLAESCLQYRHTLSTASKTDEVLKALRQAQQLSAVFSQQAELQLSVPDWMYQALPGLQATWLEDQQRFGWYVDYRAFWPSAIASSSVEDEQLLELYYLAYPLDSIGYRFPGWMLEVAPGEAYSLLGRGEHLAFLRALSQVAAKSNQPEAQQLQQMLLNDIVRQDVAFWESRERVVQELSQIADLPVLDSATRDTLAARLEQWSVDSLPSRVTFNHRAGLHSN